MRGRKQKSPLHPVGKKIPKEAGDTRRREDSDNSAGINIQSVRGGNKGQRKRGRGKNYAKKNSRTRTRRITRERGRQHIVD